MLTGAMSMQDAAVAGRPATPRAAAMRALRGLRLLIVADSSSTHTHRWARWAAEGGARVTVLSIAPEPIEGATVHHFPGPRRWYHRVPKLRMLLDYPRFRRLVRSIDPQLVHFHFVSEGGRAFYWDAVKAPKVASAWGQDVIFDGPPYRGAEASLRRVLATCRAVTATTHQLAAATARFAAPGMPIHLIPFGVDLERFRPREGGEARDAGRAPTVGFVKHLLPKYGPDVLIEAFELVRRSRPDARLVMAGRGPMLDDLKRDAERRGLSPCFLGRVAHGEVPELIRSFDVMAMPSVYESETFGVAAVEASACGVPVVASRVGGVAEAVVDGKTGLLVEPRDPQALAEALLRVLEDAELRRRLGAAGRRFVERHYDWRENASRMAEVYRAVLEGESPRDVPVFDPSSPPDLSVPD